MTKPSHPIPRLALAGGYTAGHVMPMLAVAEAWQARFPGAKPIFLGQKGGLEANLLHGADLPFFGVAGRPLYGTAGLADRLASYGTTLVGLLQARQILRRERAGLVIGFGGYVTAGILLAARSLGLTTAIFEANLLPGQANRRLARHVDLRFVNWPGSRDHAGWQDAQVVGMPLRRAVGIAATGMVSAPDAAKVATRRLLVTGGSLGSAHFNHHAPLLAARLAAQLRQRGEMLEVLHQAGSHAPAASIAAAYHAAGIAARVSGFIDDMPAAWRWADAALCAAGAGTLAELQHFGLPALIVPLAAVADDHQRGNAEAFAAATGLPWMPEAAWDADRASTALATLLTGPPNRQPSGTADDAAAAIVAACAAHLGLGAT